ncbi:MAG: FtsW/RodA/SpoVE family cell cycle protein [Rhizobacter sp.]|nr:FtsW/RodA/SpoVE family cell cycle protein [Bacteriovorax sp.]
MKKLTPQSVLFFIPPILATLFGIYTVVQNGIPASVFYPNIIGILIGIILMLYLSNRWKDKRPTQVMQISFISLFLLLACFLFPGEHEVHRWIRIGGFGIEISMIVIPLALWCIYQLLHDKYFLHSIVLFAATVMILAFQPDASQTTALSLAGLVLFFKSKTDIKYRLASVVIAAVALYYVWTRVDLLDPIEYVEDIFEMMVSLGPVGIAGLFICSVALIVPFILMEFKRIETVRTLSTSFIVYLAASMIIAVFGHYPVMVMGAGASSVVGWYLMLSFVLRTL